MKAGSSGENMITPYPAPCLQPNQVKNGGALSISEECTVTFMGTAKFIDNSVLIKQQACGEGCSRFVRGQSYVVKKGGAIHNKVLE